ncbi:hypothetical protein CP965_09195 [Halarcobacter mediterraneus]|uniref:histidine kinase n=1 Tax=Halarcobacter mediterraneus TaxID=2023153 RepID=A0A4Q1AYL1_9BACT|nr:transporter substrate-binding domain-containing protein [Halarcobacter mediterraneus]RXK12740.1 hypothetical protein CP965_09195 [Halarcobacter mediterraneus]
MNVIYKYFFFIIIFSSTLFASNKNYFTKEELAYIEKNPVISVAMLNNFQPFSYGSNLKHRGFSLEVLKRIEDFSGLKFYIKTSKWKESLNSFKNKDVDIIADISYTKKREEFASFTKAYYEIPTFIFGLKTDKNYESNKSLKGKVVAVTKGVFYIDELKENGVKVLEVESSLKKAQAVVTGKADYFLASYTTGQKAISDNTFYTLKVIDEYSYIKKEDLRFGIQKENFLLKSIIDKSLNKISIEEFNTLAKKWINDSYYKGAKINFTSEELEFIKKHPIITYSEINWKPLSIIENNKMNGIMGDYLNLVSERTGLDFKYIPSDSWTEVLEQFKNKKIDIVPGAGSSSQEKRLGLISKSYAKYPFAIVTSDKYRYLDSLLDIEDGVIAVPKSYTSYNFIIEKYPNIKLLTTNDIPEALLLVEEGRADAFVGHIATSLYYISQLHLKDLKVSGTTSFSMEHHYLIQEKYPLLLSIINKAFESISIKETKEINSNWIQTTVIEEKLDYQIAFLVIFIFIIIIAVFIYRQIILKNYNLHLKNSYNDIQNIMNSTMEAIIITENRKCIDINDSAVKLFQYDSKEEMIGQDLLNFISKESRKLVKNKILSTSNEPYELEILTSKNTKIKALGKGTNLKLTGKKVRISSLIDISDIKNKEQLLTEQSKMAALGEMIGHIAHQWRQPLSVITTIATSWEVYDEFGTFNKDKVLDESKVILSNAKYLSQTIDDFRLFAKKQDSILEYNIKDLIDNLIRLENSSIINERIELVLENKIEKKVKGSQNEMLQALINIVNNSIDALRKQENKILFIKVKSFNDRILLEFKDNAGGIDEKIINKIFEPYFTTKHQSKGTGLGLYMAYKIIKKVHATIKVENDTYIYNGTTYKGAKFTILI